MKITITFFLLVSTMLHGFTQTRKRLPEPVNLRDYIEYSPTISADGKTLIFQSDRYGFLFNALKKVPVLSAEGNTGKSQNQYQVNYFGIFQSLLHPSGDWNQANQVDPINRFFSDEWHVVIGGPAISYDGNYIYFFANCEGTKLGEGREDLFYSVREKNGWSKPINVGSQINTSGYEAFPCLSPDNKRLFFVKEITNKLINDEPCYRIMMAEKGRDGQWRPAIELPAPVNVSSEKAPRIMADGKTLIFSSLREGGRGNYDLYKTVLQDDGTWSKPINMEFVNTKKSDQHVAISACGDLMFYVVEGDIYTIPVPEDLRPYKMAIVQGQVFNSTTHLPVKARIIVKNKKDNMLVTTMDNSEADGRYTLLLPISEDYLIQVNDSNYELFETSVLKNAFTTCEPILKDLSLIPIVEKVQEVMRIPEKKEVIVPQEPTLGLAKADTVLPAVTSVSKKDSLTNSTTSMAVDSVHKKETFFAKNQEVVSKKDTLVDVAVNQVIVVDTTQKMIVSLKKDSLVNENVTKEVTATTPAKVIPKVMEEEVVTSVATPAPKQEQIVVEGEKATDAQQQSDLVLLLRVIHEETGVAIGSPTIILKTKDGTILPKEVQQSGEFWITKFTKGDSFKVEVSAIGFISANATIDNLLNDKKIAVKLKPKATNELQISVVDNATNASLHSNISIYSEVAKDTIFRKDSDGKTVMALKNNDQLVIKIAAAGYMALQKKVAIVLPEEGKTYKLEARLVKEEYRLVFNAIDVETGEPITNASFELIDLKTKKAIEVTGGEVTVDKAVSYNVICRVSGFLPAEQSVSNLLATNTISFKLVKERVIEKVIKLTNFGAIERGKSVVLKNITFEISESTLLPQSYKELDKLVDLMNENPSISILIKGHTDIIGDEKNNLRLSQERCNAVVAYLVEKGISKKRLTKKGYGMTEPLFNKEDERNRRVEFVIQ
jgi:outer membrane protein OmpA-like peptidoglycan-associated protein